MQAREVRNYLRDLDGGWVPEETVDTFKAGDPDAEIGGIAVAWMSTVDALDRAAELGCDLFVTHEPTFYDHWDDPDGDAPEALRAATEEKEALIDDLGITILRCHDLWDQYPEEGVADTWGRQVFPEADRVGGEGYYRVYDRDEATPAREVASEIARRTGHVAVEFVGPEAEPVRLVCTGTGAATRLGGMLTDYEADLYVCSDDGFVYWRDGPLAEDVGIPVVVVNHGASEERAMATLAAHLKERFEVPVHHLEQGRQYELIEG